MTLHQVLLPDEPFSVRYRGSKRLEEMFEIQAMFEIQGAFTNHNLCCYPTSHSMPSWRTRYRGSRPSARRAYRSLQGVIEKSVEPPKCSILIFLTG